MYCVKIYIFIGKCGANILICIKRTQQMKIVIIIDSKKNNKYKKVNAISGYYMSQFNGRQKNVNTNY